MRWWRFETGSLGQWQGVPVSCIVLTQVVVPGTFMEYTSRRVLTSTWIDGEKLSQSKADNVAELVNVGVVSYLHQLLDIGAQPLMDCWGGVPLLAPGCPLRDT